MSWISRGKRKEPVGRLEFPPREPRAGCRVRLKAHAPRPGRNRSESHGPGSSLSGHHRRLGLVQRCKMCVVAALAAGWGDTRTWRVAGRAAFGHNSADRPVVWHGSGYSGEPTKQAATGSCPASHAADARYRRLDPLLAADLLAPPPSISKRRSCQRSQLRPRNAKERGSLGAAEEYHDSAFLDGG